MPTAVLFPGQGAHTPEMRDLVASVRPDLLEIAGEECFARAGESTRFAQPAILCASLAGWTRLRDRLGEPPYALAGHSLGELSALAAAGAIDEADAVRLVALRGRLMEAAGGDGGMLAALGADRDQLVRVARAHAVVVANDNAPGQVVLSGARGALAAAAADLRAGGARALELDVTGAFHSRAMAPALPAWTAALAEVRIREPRFAVWSCVTAAPLRGVEDVRARLAQGLTSPVRWRALVEALGAAGVDRFVDAGPAAVLTKLVKRTLRSAEAVAADRLPEVAHA